MSAPLDISTFWKADGPVTLEERTYRFLHEMITSGMLAPGEKLVGLRLATEIGVSRITVANALRRLASEGFVVVLPHRKAIVASLDMATMNEIFRIRHALESEVLSQAAREIMPETLQLLYQLDAQIRDSIAEGDARAYRRHERDFHFLIYASSNLPLMTSLLTDLWNRLEPYRGRRYSSEALLETAMDDHRAVLNALAARDQEGAVRTMRTHVERGHTRFLQVLDAAASDDATASAHQGASPNHRKAIPWISPDGSLQQMLDRIPDTRRPQGRVHAQSGVLALAVCAMLCGARSRYAVTRWGGQCHPAIREAFGLPGDQAPSGATIHRIFTNLSSQTFERSIAAWISMANISIPDTRISDSGTHHQGIHGEQLPGIAMLAEIAAYLRAAGSNTSQPDARVVNAVFGTASGGAGGPFALATLQLRQAMMLQEADKPTPFKGQ
ncbi:MAG: FCD domain-containing protein [Thermomicrobiales bacterium]